MTSHAISETGQFDLVLHPHPQKKESRLPFTFDQPSGGTDFKIPNHQRQTVQTNGSQKLEPRIVDDRQFMYIIYIYINWDSWPSGVPESLGPRHLSALPTPRASLRSWERCHVATWPTTTWDLRSPGSSTLRLAASPQTWRLWECLIQNNDNEPQRASKFIVRLPYVNMCLSGAR